MFLKYDTANAILYNDLGKIEEDLTIDIGNFQRASISVSNKELQVRVPAFTLVNIYYYREKNWVTITTDLQRLVNKDLRTLDGEYIPLSSTAYDGVDSKNPLAWPLFASNEDLIGLPPHVISVNELDPLRDEGLLYYKKLLISGVDASSITINGTVHAGDMIFINATPKIYRSSLMHINNFANSL